MRTKEEVIQNLMDVFSEKEEVFCDYIEALDRYCGCLYDDLWLPMSELNNELEFDSPMEILGKARFGYAYGNSDEPFNPYDEYFRYNGYGNLVSHYKKDYSDYLDEDHVTEMYENRRALGNVIDADVEALFDELDAIEETEN